MSFWRNFLRGIASISLFPPQHEQIRYIRYKRYKTDSEALSADWQMVGNDMRKALDKVKEEISL